MTGSGKTRSWYLDPLVAEQKRQVMQSWVRQALDSWKPEAVIKTDLFEEAYGQDRIFDDLFPGARIAVGVDVEIETVARAARIHGASFCCTACDVRRLPFPSLSVDLVLSPSTLDHFESQAELTESLDELARILRPGGMLLITLDNPTNPLYYALRWGSRRGWTPFRLGHTLSSGTLQQLLRERGFRIEGQSFLIHNPRGVSTVVFLALRKLLGRHASAPIRLLLAVFAAMGKLPSRRFTACFHAVAATKIAD
ncbi:MAG TPA: methyltransferase domain-containing protein [Bryobacteraceae bacterium]|nr:methyltransferase domain-containing protein [Bryobacteraceae bacterium]